MGLNRKVQLKRRDFLTGLGTVPIIGAYGATRNTSNEANSPKESQKRESIRLGIIGFGFRGEQLARATKHAHPDWIREQEKASGKTSGNSVIKQFYEQEDLNIEYRGISDLFDIRRERGVTVGGKHVTAYRDYRDLLAQLRGDNCNVVRGNITIAIEISQARSLGHTVACF